uniref:Uncharacterized protein n=1 Tax=Anopheles albimanus TaxID=7167 RepID=A0A182FXM4_ANOAL
MNTMTSLSYETGVDSLPEEHLEIDQQKEFAVDMPELKSFEGSLDVLQQACYNPQQLVLTKLKHAILTDYSENQLSVVDRLAALETLQ